MVKESPLCQKNQWKVCNVGSMSPWKILITQKKHPEHYKKWILRAFSSVSVTSWYLMNSGLLVCNISILHESFLNWSIWLIDGTLTGSSTPSQSGPGSNDNEGVHVSIRLIAVPYKENSRFGACSIYLFWCYYSCYLYRKLRHAQLSQWRLR